MATTVSKHSLPSRLVTVGGRRVLLLKPHSRAFGHTGLEMLLGLHMAKEQSAAVYFVRPREVVAPALYELQSPDVQIMHPDKLRFYWNMLWLDVELHSSLTGQYQTALRRYAKLLHAFLRFRRVLPGRVKRLVGRHLAAQQEKINTFKLGPGDRPYYRRLHLRQTIPVELLQPVNERAEAIARQLGIAPDARLVTMHVREPGFKLGREIHDYKARTRDDSVRNADITTVFPAIDYLVSQGYTIVRMGDSSMTPVNRPGVVDLATSPLRAPEVEIWSLLNSEFMIACESGPGTVALLTGTPTLVLNATDPIGSYPLRPTDMFILKRMIERDTEHELTLREQLGEENLLDLRNTSRFIFRENSEEEILDAVKEMIVLQATDAPPTPLQDEYRQLTLDAALRYKDRSLYVRKWGADGTYIGDGVMSLRFLEKYLGPPITTETSRKSAAPAGA